MKFNKKRFVRRKKKLISSDVGCGEPGGFGEGENAGRHAEGFLVNMGELACYDHANRFVISNGITDDNVYGHTLASFMSGLAATTLSCPADVVKTRMMNQGSKVAYRNSIDCLVRTVRVEGMKALWKGFYPTWARLGPRQFVFWVSYEKLRVIAGISSEMHCLNFTLCTINS